MNKFDYVTNKRMREVLLSAGVDKKELSFAVDYTIRAFRADENNEDVPFEVLAVREEALDNAIDCFADGNFKTSRKFLKLFWTV